ncbi:WAS/WASL-interacting protein family member 1-like [Symsagittifera roscoffensis]|uniref:WAS/WASL-interacting protein family member 1-like n=1 Tax=Symsagittifera roscoffensis TaxID=84072 RepID=UPI00307C73E1
MGDCDGGGGGGFGGGGGGFGGDFGSGGGGGGGHDFGSGGGGFSGFDMGSNDLSAGYSSPPPSYFSDPSIYQPAFDNQTTHETSLQAPGYASSNIGKGAPPSHLGFQSNYPPHANYPQATNGGMPVPNFSPPPLPPPQPTCQRSSGCTNNPYCKRQGVIIGLFVGFVVLALFIQMIIRRAL